MPFIFFKLLNEVNQSINIEIYDRWHKFDTLIPRLINVLSADTFYAKVLLIRAILFNRQVPFNPAVVDFLVDLAKVKRKGSKLDASLSLKLCTLELQLDGQSFVYLQWRGWLIEYTGSGIKSLYCKKWANHEGAIDA